MEVKVEVKMDNTIQADSIQSYRPANSLALLQARQRFTPFLTPSYNSRNLTKYNNVYELSR